MSDAENRKGRVVVAPSEGLVQHSDRLHVLLRHRLLRQLGGFEGLGAFADRQSHTPCGQAPIAPSREPAGPARTTATSSPSESVSASLLRIIPRPGRAFAISLRATKRFSGSPSTSSWMGADPRSPSPGLGPSVGRGRGPKALNVSLALTLIAAKPCSYRNTSTPLKAQTRGLALPMAQSRRPAEPRPGLRQFLEPRPPVAGVSPGDEPRTKRVTGAEAGVTEPKSGYGSDDRCQGRSGADAKRP